MKDQDPADWDDLCQLYLLDELSDDEQESFESRLATSSGLRSTLAQQAELLSLIGEVKATDTIPSASLARRWNLPQVAAAVSTLAALALFVVWIGHEHDNVAQVSSQPQDESLQTTVAQVWASNRSLPGLPTFEVDNIDTADEFGAQERNEEVPSWLALGVASATAEHGDTFGDSIDG